MANRRIRAAALAVGLSAVALLAGCTGDDGGVRLVDVNGHMLPNACSLLTSAEIALVTGQETVSNTAPPPASGDIAATVCVWQSDSGSPGDFIEVRVEPRTGGQGYERAIVELNFPPAQAVSIPGAGDAFIGRQGVLLAMAVDPYSVFISYYEDGAGDVTAATTELAGLVAGALGGG